MAETETIETIADSIARKVRDGKPSDLHQLPAETGNQVLDYMKTDVFKARNPDHRDIVTKITDERLLHGESFAKAHLRKRPAPPPGTDWAKMLEDIKRCGRDEPTPHDPGDGVPGKKSAFKRGA